jgi:hypothetical protein
MKNKDKVTVVVDMQVCVSIDNFEHNALCDLSEDQIDDIQMLASDALPQHVEVEFCGKMMKCFVEIEDIEEINFFD